MTIVKNESGVITSVVLPVIVDGYEWECNKDRMWNLNELHKALRLDENQRPSEWDNKVSRELLSSGNLRKVDKVGTYATEQAAIAYAMWVSVPFYMTVINAFIELRNDNVIKASNLAKQNQTIQPISNVEFDKLRSRGWSITDAIKKAGIPNAVLVNRMLKSGQMHNPFYAKRKPRDLSEVAKGAWGANEKGRINGYWKKPEGDGRFNNDGVKVIERGFEWFKEHAPEINRQVAIMKGNAKRRSRR
ncbi:KilA-N domain-containing protein [Kluyvera sp. SCKS090646]|uniref:KilA-N domain-containing protein n=1 Tax=Kluyvera sichuanensis TaxID=2725494 RepID=A0ABR6S1F3_9ENTR|nr:MULTISPECIES: KilA-N domain-containing protein [Kluyvera]MBC1189140.1 KilA-N domain-containing protein [Kluyvera sichuanensis]MDA8495458.1 KilA-N domain-containing protein [Kluyvera georgiana]